MRGPRARWLAVALIAGALPTSSCLFGDDPDDTRRASLEFVSLAIPSRAGLTEPAHVEVSFLVGTDGCWEVEGLTARLARGDVVIDGTAVRRGGQRPCTLEVIYASRTLELPLLPAGRFLVRAGALVDTLDAVEGGGGVADRIHLRSAILVHEGGCGTAFFADRVAILSYLPPDIPRGWGTWTVRGRLMDEDPCNLDDEPFPADYLVSVDEVTPAE